MTGFGAGAMVEPMRDLPLTSPNGVLLIDKPRGMTSHDVVNRVRRVGATRQVGHTGTLDPMATGLLVLCLGRATRIAQFLQGLDKVYTGRITLGAISSTYDAEGNITEQARVVPNNADPLREAMKALCGQRTQLPPPYSAVKVKGKKLYEYARAGAEVPQKPRPVAIRRFELLEYEPPQLQFRATVGSGAYIRSMAHDLGLALGCGAFLSELRRLRVGGFDVEHALPLEGLIEEPRMLGEQLMGLSEALPHLPKVTLAPQALKGALHGRTFADADVLELDRVLTPGQTVLVVDAYGRAVSVSRVEARANGHVDEEGLGATPLEFKPIRVLARPDEDG